MNCGTATARLLGCQLSVGMAARHSGSWSSWSAGQAAPVGRGVARLQGGQRVPNHNDSTGARSSWRLGGSVGLATEFNSYQLPEYFTQSVQHRYGFYRKSTAGHNTLTFDNDNNDNSNRGACDQYPGMAGITEITLFNTAPAPPLLPCVRNQWTSQLPTQTRLAPLVQRGSPSPNTLSS